MVTAVAAVLPLLLVPGAAPKPFGPFLLSFASSDWQVVSCTRAVVSCAAWRLISACAVLNRLEMFVSSTRRWEDSCWICMWLWRSGPRGQVVGRTDRLLVQRYHLYGG